jgi:hypothetical protein
MKTTTVRVGYASTSILITMMERARPTVRLKENLATVRGLSNMNACNHCLLILAQSMNNTLFKYPMMETKLKGEGVKLVSHEECEWCKQERGCPYSWDETNQKLWELMHRG